MLMQENEKNNVVMVVIRFTPDLRFEQNIRGNCEASKRHWVYSRSLLEESAKF